MPFISGRAFCLRTFCGAISVSYTHLDVYKRQSVSHIGVEYNEQENEEEDFKSVHASISLYIFNISLAVFSHEMCIRDRVGNYSLNFRIFPFIPSSNTGVVLSGIRVSFSVFPVSNSVASYSP